MDAGALNDSLLEVEKFILNECGFVDRRLYRSSPEMSCADTHASLQRRAAGFVGLPDRRGEERFRDQIDFYNAADAIYRFFFPVEADGPIVRKYWGLIYSLLQVRRIGVVTFLDIR